MMDEEAFDENLRMLVSRHDQQRKPSFNRDKVFSRTKQNTQGRYRWLAGIAASILLVGVAFLSRNDIRNSSPDQELAMTDTIVQKIGSEAAGLKSSAARDIQATANSTAEAKAQPRVNERRSLAERVITVPAVRAKPVLALNDINETALPGTAPKTEIALPTVLARTATPLAAAEDMQISFKRGRTASTEMAVSLKPANRRKFDFKKMRTSDSSSYVETKPFKFKFKL